MPPLVTTDFETQRTSTVDSFLANLPEMLGAMVVDPRTKVTVVDFGAGRYWQCRTEPDGSIIIEVVSNQFLTGDKGPLSRAGEQRLRDVGFTEPSPGPKPNWRVEASGLSEWPRLTSLTVAAVYDVFGEQPQNEVRVRTWEHQRPRDRDHDDDRGGGRNHDEGPTRSRFTDPSRRFDAGSDPVG